MWIPQCQWSILEGCGLNQPKSNYITAPNNHMFMFHIILPQQLWPQMHFVVFDHQGHCVPGASESYCFCFVFIITVSANDLALNTLRTRQNGRLFADNIFQRMFFNQNVWISITISLKFVPKGPINNIPTLVQIMAWRRSGNKPLSESMLVSLPMHICVTWPQTAVGHQQPQCWLLIAISSYIYITILSMLSFIPWNQATWPMRYHTILKHSWVLATRDSTVFNYSSHLYRNK